MNMSVNPGLKWYVGATLAGLVAIALWLIVSNAGRQNDALPRLGTVPPFSLTTESGAGADDHLFSDRVTVVDFIFTSCSGICPMMTGRMAWLQGELGDRNEVQFVSFSVDPETDTPEVLTEYGKRYGAIPGRWTFLTGDRAKIYSVSREGFRLGLETEGDDAILHSPKFVLVDRQGTIRGYYDSDSTGAMETLLAHARRLAKDPGA
jgi:protein SCO1/2